jgi:hypothetical protein
MAFMLLAAWGLGDRCAADAADTPKELPKDVIGSWKKAGAQAGWMRLDRFDGLRLDGDVPGFRIFVWKEGVVVSLPAPPAPFGLYLMYTNVTDAGLKELPDSKRCRRWASAAPGLRT